MVRLEVLLFVAVIAWIVRGWFGGH